MEKTIMDEAVEYYTQCLKEHMDALKQEGFAKENITKTRYALLKARDEMRAMERQVLEDNLRNL